MENNVKYLTGNDIYEQINIWAFELDRAKEKALETYSKHANKKKRANENAISRELSSSLEKKLALEPKIQQEVFDKFEKVIGDIEKPTSGIFSILESEISKYKQIKEDKESLQNNIFILNQLVDWNSSLSSLDSYFKDISSHVIEASIALKDLCDKINSNEENSSNNSNIQSIFHNSKIYSSIKQRVQNFINQLNSHLEDLFYSMIKIEDIPKDTPKDKTKYTPSSIKVEQFITIGKQHLTLRNLLDSLFILSSPSVVKNMGEEQEQRHSKLLNQMSKDIMNKIIDPILLFAQHSLKENNCSSSFTHPIIRVDGNLVTLLFESVSFTKASPSLNIPVPSKEYGCWIFSETMECIYAVFSYLRDYLFKHILISSSTSDHNTHDTHSNNWKKEMETVEIEIVREYLTQHVIFSFANYSFLPSIYHCNPLPISRSDVLDHSSLQITHLSFPSLPNELKQSISYTHLLISKLLEWKNRMVKEGFFEDEDLDFINTIQVDKTSPSCSGFMDEKVALKWRSQLLDISRSFLLSLFDPSIPSESVTVQFPSSFSSFYSLVEKTQSKEESKESKEESREESRESSNSSEIKISKSVFSFVKANYEILNLGKKIFAESEILNSLSSKKEMPILNYNYCAHQVMQCIRELLLLYVNMSNSMIHSFSSPANKSDNSESDLPSSFPIQDSPISHLLVLHNDSLFIASHIPILDLACRSISSAKQSSSLSTIGGDIILIPLLQRIASSSISLILEKEKEHNFQLIEQTNGFHDTHKSGRYSIVSECFNHLVARFVSLSPLLKDYLPKDLYHRVLGSLLDDVLTQIIVRLLKLSDIAEAETHKLYEILISMFKCENLFDSELLPVSVPSWIKFIRSAEILELSLAAIDEHFESGDYEDFTKQELTHFVKALFADTPNRRKLLNKLSA